MVQIILSCSLTLVIYFNFELFWGVTRRGGLMPECPEIDLIRRDQVSKTVMSMRHVLTTFCSHTAEVIKIKNSFNIPTIVRYNAFLYSNYIECTSKIHHINTIKLSAMELICSKKVLDILSAHTLLPGIFY